MKSGISLLALALLGLSPAFSAAKPAAPKPVVNQEPLSQEQRGENLIHAILRSQPADSVAVFFQDSVRPNLTEENLASLRQQVGWLSGMIGDSLEPFMSGTRTFGEDHRKAFYREYRLANEINRRAPLVLLHVWFPDSSAGKAEGIFVKNFLGDKENRLGEAQTWHIGDRDVDIHSVATVDLGAGTLLIVNVYDEPLTPMDSLSVLHRAVPIVREAIARGYQAKARLAAGSKQLLEPIGIALYRKDPQTGYTQAKFRIDAKYYRETPPDSAAAKKPARKTAAKKKKKAAKK